MTLCPSLTWLPLGLPQPLPLLLILGSWPCWQFSFTLFFALEPLALRSSLSKPQPLFLLLLFLLMWCWSMPRFYSGTHICNNIKKKTKLKTFALSVPRMPVEFMPNFAFFEALLVDVWESAYSEFLTWGNSSCWVVCVRTFFVCWFFQPTLYMLFDGSCSVNLEGMSGLASAGFLGVLSSKPQSQRPLIGDSPYWYRSLPSSSLKWLQRPKEAI